MKWLNVVPVAQRNPLWRNAKLGFSETTIGSYGCLVTSMGMVAGVNPIEMNARMKAAKGFNGNLVANFDVSKFVDGAPKLIRTTSKYASVPFPQDEIDHLISRLRMDKPAILEVDMNIATATQDQHFVLAVGAYGFGSLKHILINDPWYEDQTTICPRYGGTLARALVRAIYYE